MKKALSVVGISALLLTSGCTSHQYHSSTSSPYQQGKQESSNYAPVYNRDVYMHDNDGDFYYEPTPESFESLMY